MATPYNQSNLTDLYNNQESSLYANPSIYGPQNPDSDPIWRQPYVWVTPDSSNLEKYASEYDTNGAPIGSSAIDTVRVGKFLTSTRGILFLATQTFLQGQNVFNETSLYNPLSIPLTIASDASLGLLGAPTRFIPLDLLGGSPAGTLTAALPSLNIDEGAGLQRARTAAAGYNNFSTKYGGGTSVVGFLSQLASSLAPNLAPLPSQVGTYKIGDTIVYDTMLSNLGNANSMFAYYDQNGVAVLPKQNYSAPSSQTPTSVISTITSIANSLPVNFGTGNILSPPPIVSEDSTYTGTITNNTPDGSLIEELWKTWSSPANAASQFGGTGQVQSSVSDVTSQLKKILSNKSIASVVGGGSLTGGIGGIASSLPGIGTIKNYTQALGSLSSSDLGLSAPSNGYSSLVSSLDPTSMLTGLNGKQFPNAGLSGTSVDTYNATTLAQAKGDPNNSNAAFQNAANDLIAFYFSDIVNGQFIPFRATLTALTIDNASSWTPIRYIGRADRLFVYEGFEKTISFGLKVYATSPEEMAPMWARINYLVSLTSPSDYTSGPDGSNFIVPPFVKLTIGDLQKNLPIVLTSVNVSVPEDASWELTADAASYSYLSGMITRSAAVGQLPMYVEISITANVLEKFRPRAGNLQFSDVNTNMGNAMKGPSAITSNSPSSSPVGSNPSPAAASTLNPSTLVSTATGQITKIAAPVTNFNQQLTSTLSQPSSPGFSF